MTVGTIWLSLGKQGSILFFVSTLFLLSPFVHCVAYIFPDYPDVHETKVWGLACNPYQFDRAIIGRLTCLGVLSGLGWYAGYSLMAPRNSRTKSGRRW